MKQTQTTRPTRVTRALDVRLSPFADSAVEFAETDTPELFDIAPLWAGELQAIRSANATAELCWSESSNWARAADELRAVRIALDSIPTTR